MLNNTELTVYHKENDSWLKYNYKNVWWFSKKDADINTTYSKDNDVNIRIWNNNNINNFKIGDIVVQGILDIDIQNQDDLSNYLVYNIIQLKNNNILHTNSHIHVIASLFQTKVVLQKATKVKQNNGTFIDEYTFIDSYYTQKQSLEDEVSATVYGANLNNMLRLKSTDRSLEDYLKTKLNNKADNISKYFIFIGNVQYKIVAVNDYIDVLRIGVSEETPSL